MRFLDEVETNCPPPDGSSGKATTPTDHKPTSRAHEPPGYRAANDVSSRDSRKKVMFLLDEVETICSVCPPPDGSSGKATTPTDHEPISQNEQDFLDEVQAARTATVRSE